MFWATQTWHPSLLQVLKILSFSFILTWLLVLQVFIILFFVNYVFLNKLLSYLMFVDEFHFLFIYFIAVDFFVGLKFQSFKVMIHYIFVQFHLIFPCFTKVSYIIECFKSSKISLFLIFFCYFLILNKKLEWCLRG